jgi:hypothetical protein
VCDFSSYDAGRSLFLYNSPDPARTTSETPFFCYSHLVMKINISGKGAAPAVKPKMVFGPEEGFLETNVALNSTYLQVAHLPLLLIICSGATLPKCYSLPSFVAAYCAVATYNAFHACGGVMVWSQQAWSCGPAETAGQLLRFLLCTLQSLMERALAGQFDRSLKFGHSGGIWQVNDKGWEDDHDHIDFDVSQTPVI